MSVVIDVPRASALDRPGLDQGSTPSPQADGLDPVKKKKKIAALVLLVVWPVNAWLARP